MKEKVAELLREELLKSKEPWWYITFDGGDGILLPGCGPTDAWVRMHALNVFIGGTTGMRGPVDADILAKVPEEIKLVRLSTARFDKLMADRP